MFVRYLISATVVVASCANMSHARDEHGHADIEVGKAANSQLAIAFDFDGPIGLVPVNGPLLFGCAFDDPGFMSLGEDEPEEGLFVLPPGGNVMFELVAIDRGVLIHTPGFADILDMPGEQFTLGNPFDTHPTFHIDSTHPAWNPNGIYSVTFRLLDGNGVCDPSPDYTALLQCAEPGACCLPDGSCEDGEFDGLCEDEGGEFLGEGSVCASGGCAEGACCLPNGSCEQEIEAHCEEEGGEFAGPATDCASACGASAAPVPAMTTWSMVWMCCLLACGLVLRTRRSRTDIG